MSESFTKNTLFGQDKNLWLRLKKYKDRQAFIKAYDLYVKELYRFIFFKVGDAEEAKDLTSQVFVKSWTYVQEGKLNDRDNYHGLKSFLYKVARNSVIDYYRSRKPEISLEELEDTGELTRDQLEVQSLKERQIDSELIKAKLDELKVEYRGLIVMRYINQLSIAEIAEILNKSRAATRVSVFRALQALKNLLNQ